MIETLARALSGLALECLPDAACRLGRHSELAIFSDFLEAPEKLATGFQRHRRQGVRGHVVQILDPAEESLPYQDASSSSTRKRRRASWAERAEALRESYQKKLAAHKAAIASTRADWAGLLSSTTRTARRSRRFLPLHMHLSGLEKAYRAKGTLKGELAGEGEPS